MNDTIQSIRIHDHAGRVAFDTNETDTIYLTPKLALLFAKELIDAAHDITNGNDYPTTIIKE